MFELKCAQPVLDTEPSLAMIVTTDIVHDVISSTDTTTIPGTTMLMILGEGEAEAENQ